MGAADSNTSLSLYQRKSQARISVSVSNVLRDRRKLSLKRDGGYAGTTLST